MLIRKIGKADNFEQEDGDMFILKKMIHSISRNMGRSVLLIAISFIFVSFAGLYFGGMVRNQKLLISLGERIPVTATITDSDGAREMGLSISEKIITDFLELEITDYTLAAESYGNIDMSSLVAGGEKVSTYITGANAMSAFTISEEEMTLDLDEAKAVLSSNDAYCIMNLAYIEERGLSLQEGDILDINLFRAKYDEFGFAYEFEEVASAQIKIAGFYQGTLGDGDVKQPDIICPIEWLRQQYTEAKTHFFYTSATGNVINPLQINVLKEKAEELEFKQINIQASQNSKDVSLAIDDRLFVQSASQIMRNIQILKLFAVPVMILIILLEALVFFLTMGSRKREIYIARCLGRKKIAITVELMLESFLLALAGGLLATLLLVLVGFSGWIECGVILIGFMCFELVGSFIPAVMLSHTNPMKSFSQAG